jgi:hypothetical protein
MCRSFNVDYEGLELPFKKSINTRIVQSGRKECNIRLGLRDFWRLMEEYGCREAEEGKERKGRRKENETDKK